jgi:hypothetical protein
MNKYYELTVKLTRYGFEKKIEEYPLIEQANCYVTYYCDKWGMATNTRVEQLIFCDSSKEVVTVGTANCSKLDLYYNQAKVLIIENLQQERDRINKLLEMERK